MGSHLQCPGNPWVEGAGILLPCQPLSQWTVGAQGGPLGQQGGAWGASALTALFWSLNPLWVSVQLRAGNPGLVCQMKPGCPATVPVALGSLRVHAKSPVCFCRAVSVFLRGKG